MNKIKFYRGLFSAYSTTTHADVVYFATDTKEIYMNGVAYTGSLSTLTATVESLASRITTVETTLANKVDKVDGSSLISAEKLALIDANASNISSIQDELNSLSGGAGSVANQINNALGNLDVTAASGDYVASISQTDGLISATMGTFSFDEAGAAAQALADAKTYTDSAVAAEATTARAAEKTNADAIATVKATLDAFLADADTTASAVDTLKEIQDYINSDGTAASEMVLSISAAQSTANEAKSAAETAQSEVDALEIEVAAIKSTADAAATSTALANEVSRAQAAEAAINDKIGAMDLAAVSGYITSVSQVDGLVSASKVDSIPAADVSVADAAEYFDGATVEAVLVELADMWNWYEA